MKKNHVFLIFSTILTFLIFNACKTNSVSNEHDFLPKIINPTYKSYSQDGERGYVVSFEVSDKDMVPTAVVIHKIKQNITQTDKNGNTYTINVIAQSTAFDGYKPTGSKLPNGVMFLVDETYYLQEVNFKKQ